MKKKKEIEIEDDEDEDEEDEFDLDEDIDEDQMKDLAEDIVEEFQSTHIPRRRNIETLPFIEREQETTPDIPLETLLRNVPTTNNAKKEHHSYSLSNEYFSSAYEGTSSEYKLAENKNNPNQNPNRFEDNPFTQNPNQAFQQNTIQNQDSYKTDKANKRKF